MRAMLSTFVLAFLMCAPGYADGPSGCAIIPIKPIPPIGCKDLRAVCVCDATGLNCHIEWECVPKGAPAVSLR